MPAERRATITSNGVTATRAAVSLDDKYLREEGTVFLTGLQALVRLLVDQHRADRRAGLHTAAFVSGYPG